MASLYKRHRSPYWWVEYIDAAGERRQESTKLRHALPGESRKAKMLRNELSTREASTKFNAHGIGEAWAAWVPRFIAQRYSGSPLTRLRIEEAWHNLAAFFNEKQIRVPRQLTRQQIRDFIQWRLVAHPESGTHKASKNTALLEIKFLGLIVNEAIESGFCETNPCQRLGIGRDEPEPKPKITIDEHRLITRSLKKEAEWKRVAYKIAWEQGCRLSETAIDLADVNLATNTLRLRTKGHKKRVAEVPLSPRLRPVFRRLLAEKRERTFNLPRNASKLFNQFFAKIGLGHLSFHSTRVSFITRCYEAGIAEPDVMRLVLHASSTVHRIYPRLPAASKHLQETMRRLVA